MLLALGALAAAGALGGCSSAVSPDDPVYQQIDQLQTKVDRLQHVVGGQAMMNMASQQQQSSEQLSTLQGEVQDLEHRLQQMQSHQQLVNRDFDQRLAALGQGSTLATPGVGAGPGAGNGAGSAGGNYFPTGPIALAASASAPPVASANASATPTPSQGADSEAYQAAFDQLRAGNYSAAVRGFDAFIKKYPQSSYVPNAWYWMGETHYVNGEYKDAIDNFQQVVTKYPSSAKASDAYLKMGYAQYALKDYNGAQATFKSVISHYPGTPAASLAQQRLQQMGAPGQ
ncbi:MAG TPA: tol-pal system protein YbgF [Gammaproteobacteria bacterium]|nr:tol-pal system protein YbgF [Gammaproteobacteria bacterium]